MPVGAMLATLSGPWPLEASLFLAGVTTIFAAGLLACLAIVRCCDLEEGRLPSVVEGAALVLTCLAAAAVCGLPAAMFIALAAGVTWWRLPEPTGNAAADGAPCCCRCRCRGAGTALPGVSKAAGSVKPDLCAAEDAV